MEEWPTIQELRNFRLKTASLLGEVSFLATLGETPEAIC
jgi:hypothetical protein